MTLVEEMHKVTNSYVRGVINFSLSNFNPNRVQLFADEAVEEENYDLAKEYLLLVNKMKFLEMF